MANKLNAYPSQQVGMGIVKLDFSFEGNGGLDPEVDSIQGDMGEVVLIDRTGTGTLDIALKDPFFKLISALGGPQSSLAATSGQIYATGATNEGTSTPLVISVENAGGVDFVAGEKYAISVVLQTFNAGTR